MLHKQVEVAFPSTCNLGEGPVWDSVKQQILWLDITQERIHCFSPETKQHSIIQTGQMVGSIALTETGDILAALQNGFHLIDRDTHEITFLKDPEADVPANRFNDGKCDPAGRFWAGTMPISGGGTGNLYMLDADLEITPKISNTKISNGLAWSPDNKTFYFIDTPTRQVVAYDYDLASGDISNSRVVVSIPEGEGFPDGMTIDTEGMLWIAFWDGWRVARWNPHRGDLLEEIPLPVARPTSCCFGGREMDELYISSARHGRTEEEWEDQPLAGALFVVKNTRFRGRDAYRFRMV